MMISKNSIHLIHVFSNCYHYNKEYKGYLNRKKITQWNSFFNTGWQLSEDLKTLTLSKDYYEKREGFPGNALIIEDYNALSTLPDNAETLNNKIWNSYEEKNVWFCSLTNGVFFWKVFKLSFDKKPSIFMHWDQWEVGFPKQLDIKIAELEINKPIEILIDGKRDFSLSGRRERTFIMNDYIFDYVGVINKVEVSKKSFVIRKNFPKNIKKINLLKYVR